MMKKEFTCGKTTISREEIYYLGYDPSSISDEVMQRIADIVERKMVEAEGLNYPWSESILGEWYYILDKELIAFDIPHLKT